MSDEDILDQMPSVQMAGFGIRKLTCKTQDGAMKIEATKLIFRPQDLHEIGLSPEALLDMIKLNSSNTQ